MIDEQAPTILIADDDTFVREALREVLGRSGYRLCEARDGEEAIEMLEQERPNVVLLDLFMPKKSGLEVLAEAHAHYPDSRVLVLSSMHAESMVDEALNSGATAFIGKPFHPLEIAASVRAVLSS